MRRNHSHQPFKSSYNIFYFILLAILLILSSCGAEQNSQPPAAVKTRPPAQPTILVPTATPTPTATARPEPVGLKGDWNLIFHDDFDGSALNTKVWKTCYFNFKLGDSCYHDDGELELYRPGGVLVNDGNLTLQAKKQTVTTFGRTFHYTSGMISSGPDVQGGKEGFTFKYGYMEMRAKIAGGQGMWSAFWALPADLTWPPEVDAFEILGATPSIFYMTYHYAGANGSDVGDGTQWTGPDFSDGWHTFGLDWEPGSFTWYVDGVARRRYTSANVVAKPMYIVASLAVGGDWPGAPNATTPFPGLYQIDYIRVWQK